MKKQILAVSIMAAMAAASTSVLADVDSRLYGSLRLYASSGDAKDLDISNDASRIGIKGSATTAIDGMKAIFRLEAAVGNDNGTDSSATQNEASFGVDGRLAWVGLEGDFGRVVVGQQWTTLYDMVTGVVDVTINTDGETFRYWRADSALSWLSPDMAGLQLALATFADADDSSSEKADHYQAAVRYKLGDLTLAAGFDRAADPTLEDVLALSANWVAGDLTLAALVQRTRTDLAGAKALQPYEMVLSWALASDQTLMITGYDQDDADNHRGFNLELHSALGANTTIYTNLESDYADSGDALAGGVGLKVDF